MRVVRAIRHLNPFGPLTILSPGPLRSFRLSRSVIPSACVSRPGPRVRSRSFSVFLLFRMIASPSVGISARMRTAPGVPSLSVTTFSNGQMWHWYTYARPAGPNMGAFLVFLPLYAWLPGSSSPVYASVSTMIPAVFPCLRTHPISLLATQCVVFL